MFDNNSSKIRSPSDLIAAAPRQMAVALILVAALLAFELFNYDTTKFALSDLLGNVRFLGMSWAAILAFAFCAIDFAGLVRIFTPEQGVEEPKEVWYLMGAWLLGATMNAIMTWYAVSLLLYQRPLGTDVLDRQQMLTIVPIFVAVFVWLTRILFIGSLSVAGEATFAAVKRAQRENAPRRGRVVQGRPPRHAPQRAAGKPEDAPRPAVGRREEPVRGSRVRQRPPMPGSRVNRPAPMRAKGYEQDY